MTAQSEVPPGALTDLDAPQVGSGSSLADLVASTIGASVARMTAHESGVRLGTDPEDVHQFRVATRRLRSDLQTFAAALDPSWVAAIRLELRRLAGFAGPVRDGDVLAERLRTQAAALPEQDAAGVAVLLARLDREIGEARVSLVRALDEPRYDGLVDALLRAARHPPFTKTDDDLRRPASGRVERDVHRQWRRLRRTVRNLGHHPSDADLHRVRIAAKRCRYAVEAAAPVIGQPARRVAAAVADVQTVLGEHHDAIVAEAWLRAAAEAEPAAALAAGQLIAAQRADADRQRRRWRRAWRAAKQTKRAAWPQA